MRIYSGLVSIIVIAVLFTSESHANLVTNGSFESGLDGWSASRFFDVMGFYGTTDGNSALEFAFGDATGSHITQELSTEIGATYLISLDWKATHPGFQSMAIKVDGITLLDISGGYVGVYNTDLPFTHFDVAFIAISQVTNFGFFDTSPSSFQKDQIIDNVLITAVVPEPSTFAFLSLGMIGLFIRKRRRSMEKLTT